ncbi:MAG: GerMN domain-containing protein [Eubacterium sp.]|nr:GerMN domain-containing protein [Eubacterium sp.]
MMKHGKTVQKRHNNIYGLFMIMAVFFVSAFFLTGCGEDNVSSSDIIKVYYLDGAGEKLVAEDYTLKSKKNDINAVIDELIKALEKNGEKDRLISPIEPDIEFDDYLIKDKQVSLFFTGAYNNKTGITEVLSRAAIVKTLCQIDEIEKIDFFVEDQPLMVQGESIGQMDESTFVVDLGDRGEPQSRMVRLYFGDKTGEKLVPVDTLVTYPAAEKMAKLLVDCLIAGPEKITDVDVSGLVRTVPAKTVLNSVTIRDNICYLDLGRQFVELLPNVTSDVTVYSIVNTLCELPGISGVQFTIDSGVRERYGESEGFNRALERNLDIVSGES